MHSLADEDLAVRVQEGDARAFEAIFDRQVDVAFSFAYRMCGRRAIAEDVVQDAFLSLWRSGVR
jgi:RNA polymerase sigma-70 factor, ECF subfamily